MHKKTLIYLKMIISVLKMMEMPWELNNLLRATNLLSDKRKGIEP